MRCSRHWEYSPEQVFRPPRAAITGLEARPAASPRARGRQAPRAASDHSRPASARSVLLRALTARGDRIIAEHSSIDALTAVVHGEDLDALAEQDGVISVSSDARVQPSGLLSGLLGLVGGLVEVVVSVLLPNAADTSGAAVSPSV